MGDTLLTRFIGVLISPRRTFRQVAECPSDLQVISLALVFGTLFAGQMPLESRPVLYLLLSLFSGLGYVYFSGHFLVWTLKISDVALPARTMRMVVGYSLAPYIIALSLMVIFQDNRYPGFSIINLGLMIWTWSLNVYGARVVAGLPVVQAIFMTFLPLSALMFVIALIFKLWWVCCGQG